MLNTNVSNHRTKRAERHAVYLVCRAHDGTRHTFRIGRPTDLDTAHRRHQRLDNRNRGHGTVARPVRVRFEGRTYTAEWFEVRTVDDNGRGLGSERHVLAMHVPYRTVKSAV